MQRTMNEAAAQGWILRDFRVGYAPRVANLQHTSDGGPQYVSLFQRDDYDRAAHRAALEQCREAELAMLRKRREVELALAGYLTPLAKEAIR